MLRLSVVRGSGWTSRQSLVPSFSIDLSVVRISGHCAGRAGLGARGDGYTPPRPRTVASGRMGRRAQRRRRWRVVPPRAGLRQDGLSRQGGLRSHATRARPRSLALGKSPAQRLEPSTHSRSGTERTSLRPIRSDEATLSPVRIPATRRQPVEVPSAVVSASPYASPGCSYHSSRRERLGAWGAATGAGTLYAVYHPRDDTARLAASRRTTRTLEVPPVPVGLKGMVRSVTGGRSREQATPVPMVEALTRVVEGRAASVAQLQALATRLEQLPLEDAVEALVFLEPVLAELAWQGARALERAPRTQ
jgi:hypothetical protein